MEFIVFVSCLFFFSFCHVIFFSEVKDFICVFFLLHRPLYHALRCRRPPFGPRLLLSLFLLHRQSGSLVRKAKPSLLLEYSIQPRRTMASGVFGRELDDQGRGHSRKVERQPMGQKLHPQLQCRWLQICSVSRRQHNQGNFIEIW